MSRLFGESKLAPIAQSSARQLVQVYGTPSGRQSTGQYLTQSVADGRYAATNHSHTIAQVGGLQAALDGKLSITSASDLYAAKSHVHAISQVTGLQDALDGKQPIHQLLTDISDWQPGHDPNIDWYLRLTHGRFIYESSISVDSLSGTLPISKGGTGLSSPGATAGNLHWSGSNYVVDTTAYLPLTGGTLTGALVGTSATFPGGISTSSATFNGEISILPFPNGTSGDSHWRIANRSNSLSIEKYVGGGYITTHLSFSASGAATFAGGITAASFARPGGSPSKFLKEDGSVDPTAYATQASLSNYATVSSLSAYAQWSSLPGLYQPVENQRLSTFDDVLFNKVTTNDIFMGNGSRIIAYGRHCMTFSASDTTVVGPLVVTGSTTIATSISGILYASSGLVSASSHIAIASNSGNLAYAYVRMQGTNTPSFSYSKPYGVYMGAADNGDATWSPRITLVHGLVGGDASGKEWNLDNNYGNLRFFSSVGVRMYLNDSTTYSYNSLVPLGNATLGTATYPWDAYLWRLRSGSGDIAVESPLAMGGNARVTITSAGWTAPEPVAGSGQVIAVEGQSQGPVTNYLKVPAGVAWCVWYRNDSGDRLQLTAGQQVNMYNRAGLMMAGPGGDWHLNHV